MCLLVIGVHNAGVITESAARTRRLEKSRRAIDSSGRKRWVELKREGPVTPDAVERRKGSLGELRNGGGESAVYRKKGMAFEQEHLVEWSERIARLDK